MNVLQISIVGPSFENKDLSIDVLSKTTCYHTARCTTTAMY